MRHSSPTLPVVIICSSGRPEMLHQTMLSVAAQSEPCEVVLSVCQQTDVLAETTALPRVTLLSGPRGACLQRNRALRSLQRQPECIFFLDDDVELDPEYIRQIVLAYRRHPEVAVLNGSNLAHGVYPAGSLDQRTALALLDRARQRETEASTADAALLPMNTSYGCRMSLRGDLLGKVEFDERLVLYGFLEDLDLALRCLPFGSIAECGAARSVHLEVVSSRIGGLKRGYSEVINPLYIWSKRSGFPLRRAVLGSLRRTVRNLQEALAKRDTDRLRGNLLGWRDAARGRLEPERILTL